MSIPKLLLIEQQVWASAFAAAFDRELARCREYGLKSDHIAGYAGRDADRAVRTLREYAKDDRDSPDWLSEQLGLCNDGGES